MTWKTFEQMVPCRLVECNSDLKFKNTNIHMNALKLSITMQV